MAALSQVVAAVLLLTGALATPALAKDPTASQQIEAPKPATSTPPATSLSPFCDLALEWVPKAHCSSNPSGPYPYKVALRARNLGTGVCPQRNLHASMRCESREIAKRTLSLISLGPGQEATGSAALVWVVDEQTHKTHPILCGSDERRTFRVSWIHEDINNANHRPGSYTVDFSTCP